MSDQCIYPAFNQWKCIVVITRNKWRASFIKLPYNQIYDFFLNKFFFTFFVTSEYANLVKEVLYYIYVIKQGCSVKWCHPKHIRCVHCWKEFGLLKLIHNFDHFQPSLSTSKVKWCRFIFLKYNKQMMLYSQVKFATFENNEEKRKIRYRYTLSFSVLWFLHQMNRRFNYLKITDRKIYPYIP